MVTLCTASGPFGPGATFFDNRAGERQQGLRIGVPEPSGADPNPT